MEENGFQKIRKSENQFPPARISSVYKNWFPLTVVTVSAGRKKLSSKVTVFIWEKNPSPIVGKKNSFKNTFPLDRKENFSQQEYLKKYKKWFVQARNFVSTTRNEAFVEKYVSTGSSGKKIKKMVSTSRNIRKKKKAYCFH